MTALTAVSDVPGSRSLLRIYLLEAKYEFLKVFRLPGYVLPTLTFPLMFYLLFGVAFGGARVVGQVNMGTYLLATYGAFGVIGASLFGFGVGVAVERGQGWMLLKRASPMPPAAYFCAKIVMAMIFGALIVAGLFTLGATLSGVSLPVTRWLALGGTLVAGALPFCAMGLVLGTFAGPNSAPALVNLIYLPMGFASGLWIPIQFLPKFFQQIALALPGYHYGQLALGTIGASSGASAGGHLLYLVVFTLLCLAAATIGLRRSEDKTYG